MKFVCTCCKTEETDNDFKRVPSSLLPGVKFIACPDCLARKFEPRAFIIIYARTVDSKSEKVESLVKEDRYCGEPITGKELLV